jgi:hypothetical protein
LSLFLWISRSLSLMTYFIVSYDLISLSLMIFFHCLLWSYFIVSYDLICLWGSFSCLVNKRFCQKNWSQLDAFADQGLPNPKLVIKIQFFCSVLVRTLIKESVWELVQVSEPQQLRFFRGVNNDFSLCWSSRWRLSAESGNIFRVPPPPPTFLLPCNVNQRIQLKQS